MKAAAAPPSRRGSRPPNGLATVSGTAVNPSHKEIVAQAKAQPSPIRATNSLEETRIDRVNCFRERTSTALH
jgi:hypothetical protein